MGLPSGNRWAVSNLDAKGRYFFQESPFQLECSFFSWGNVTPHNPISDASFDYNFGNINPAAPYYDGQPYGETPGSTLNGNIPLNMDAARRLLGSPWHMPGTEDFKELLDNSVYIDAEGDEVDNDKADKRVIVNGVLGLYIRSKINGARMFLPCSGQGVYNTWNSRGVRGYYWTLNWTSPSNARVLIFLDGGVNPMTSTYRYAGLAIRPLWNPRDLRG